MGLDLMVQAADNRVKVTVIAAVILGLRVGEM